MIRLMPARQVPLISGEIYHVFNRGIDKRMIFVDDIDYQRALDAVFYYVFADPPYCLSRFFRFDAVARRQIMKGLVFNRKLVDIICYCLMPNHFHLLLRQLIDGGISRYLSNFQNSFTRFFNLRHNRDGQLLKYQFKASHIEAEYDLIHVSRYIHLNPYSASIVLDLDDLRGYPWSSFNTYLDEGENDSLERDTILSLFKSNGYKDFVYDHADYQKNLKNIEHLCLDDLGGHPRGWGKMEV